MPDEEVSGELAESDDQLESELEALGEEGDAPEREAAPAAPVAPAAKATAEPPAAEPPAAEPLQDQVNNLNIALKRERHSSRKMEERSAAFEAKMQDRMQRVLGVMEQAFTKPPPPPPVFEEDPEGAVRHIVDESVGRHVGGLAQHQAQREQQENQAHQDRKDGDAIAAFVQTDRTQFLEDQDMTEEEMAQAEQHYFKDRKKQFQAWNPDLSSEEIDQYMNNEVAQFWIEHFRSNSPIAETVLGMARAAGWQKNGGQQQPAAGSHLEAAAKRMGKVVPMGNTPPPKPPPSDKINLQTVPMMTDQQFDKWERDMIAGGADREDLHEELLKEVGEYL